ncbi:protein of unknown function [Rhodococcus sp. RD6.2]|uniref:hypothetical protein n=1 Tax=Rhodococcus sp. RD6.2 TaxID=260936 RepID=UPI00063BAA41|nr:hypothetical protein [Rhodococcus sp. RD6.2]CRK54584.1 protein of unknown function [Rhodococcus sp. RD6.2]
MTKNSARKKAARKYQLENPGTPFPEAYRAVATPSTPAALPGGLMVVDEGEWVDLRLGPDDRSLRVNDERRYSRSRKLIVHDVADLLDEKAGPLA